jgi:hypothetical protein
MNHGLILYIIILIGLILLLNYNYYANKKKEKIRRLKDETIDIDYFFYNTESLNNSKKRKLWIHIPNEKNARKWTQFGERNSTDLNQPYMLLCIKSIIDHCAQNYDIIIFNDTNMCDILADMDIDLSKISGALLDKYRDICLLEILYRYGGVIAPSSLFLNNSLQLIDNQDTWYVTEFRNNKNISHLNTLPSIKLTGSNQKNPELRKYIDYLNKVIVDDFGESSLAYNQDYLTVNNITTLCGKLIGTKNTFGDTVTLDDLMSDKNIKLCKTNIGLYIPADELLHRKTYQWFCYLCEEQVLKANTFISEYMREYL